MFVRVHIPTQTVEETPVPDFLIGLEPESLVDLSWTAPELGVQFCGWWPVDFQTVAYNADTHKVAGHTYVANTSTKRVVGTPVIVPLPVEEVAAKAAAKEAAFIAECIKAVEKKLDTAAKAKGYDNIITAALRAGYPGPFHDEGVAYATWMDACWAKCYEVMAKVKAGEIPMPTSQGLVAMLPVLVLP